MGIDQGKMILHLFLGQRSLHVGDVQRLWQLFRQIQLIDCLIEVDRFLDFTNFLIISQRIHGLQLDHHISILHTSTVIAGVTLGRFRVVGNHNLPIVFHVLVRLLAGLFAVIPLAVGFGHVLLIASLLAVQAVQLGLHQFEFILFGSLAVSYFPTGFCPVMIPGQEVGIFSYHLRIIVDGSPIISRLGAQQATVESGHHVVRLHLQDKVEVFDGAVVIAHLGPKQTTVVVPDKVIGVNIQGQVIVLHGSPQIVLMETGQGTVDVIAGILDTQADGTIQIVLRALILFLLKFDHRTSTPRIGIIAVQFDGLVKIAQGTDGIVLLQVNLSTHQIGARVAGRNGQQLLQIVFGGRIVFLLHVTKGQIMP